MLRPPPRCGLHEFHEYPSVLDDSFSNGIDSCQYSAASTGYMGCDQHLPRQEGISILIWAELSKAFDKIDH